MGESLCIQSAIKRERAHQETKAKAPEIKNTPNTESFKLWTENGEKESLEEEECYGLVVFSGGSALFSKRASTLLHLIVKICVKKWSWKWKKQKKGFLGLYLGRQSREKERKRSEAKERDGTRDQTRASKQVRLFVWFYCVLMWGVRKKFFPNPQEWLLHFTSLLSLKYFTHLHTLSLPYIWVSKRGVI